MAEDDDTWPGCVLFTDPRKRSPMTPLRLRDFNFNGEKRLFLEIDVSNGFFEGHDVARLDHKLAIEQAALRYKYEGIDFPTNHFTSSRRGVVWIPVNRQIRDNYRLTEDSQASIWLSEKCVVELGVPSLECVYVRWEMEVNATTRMGWPFLALAWVCNYDKK